MGAAARHIAAPRRCSARREGHSEATFHLLLRRCAVSLLPWTYPVQKGCTGKAELLDFSSGFQLRRSRQAKDPFTIDCRDNGKGLASAQAHRIGVSGVGSCGGGHREGCAPVCLGRPRREWGLGMQGQSSPHMALHCQQERPSRLHPCKLAARLAAA